MFTYYEGVLCAIDELNRGVYISLILDDFMICQIFPILYSSIVNFKGLNFCGLEI